MADASCSGPSPFKRLVDHQARDVSHHQDRLVDHSAAHAHNSFRSSPQHSARGQDGFGAFVGGNSAMPAMPAMQHDPAGRLQAHAAALRPSAPLNDFSRQANSSPGIDANSWAADFNRFSSHQQPQSQPQHRSPAQNTRMYDAPSIQMMNQAPSQLSFQSAFAQPNAGFASAFGMTNGAYMDLEAMSAQRQPVAAEFDQEMSRWMSSHSGANMDDVDAAMDQMARELELNDAALAEAEAATAQAATQHAANAHFTDLETPEIGNLSLESGSVPLQTQTQPLQEDAAETADAKGKSAVSEAAERLLESVQHENGQKWQDSVFLSLMRDFRDGRKDIVDNEIRQTADDEQGSQPAA